MKYLAAFLLSFLSNSILSQDIKMYLAETEPIRRFSGSINDKYPITMTLEYSTYGKTAGYYLYNNIRTPIPIIGNVDFLNGNLNIYELDDDFNKKAIFKAKTSGNKINGVWINLENNDTLPFYLKDETWAFNNPPTYALGLSQEYKPKNSSTIFRYCHIEIPEMECPITPSDYWIIYKSENEDNYFIIIQYRHASVGCGGLKRGYCGFGQEAVFVWLKINKEDFLIEETQRVRYQSCLHGEYCYDFEEFLSDIKEENLEQAILDCDYETYIFSKKNPELGFVKK